MLIMVTIVVLQTELAKYLYENLVSVPSIRIYGPKPSENVHRAALCSFNVEDIHPTDLATILDQQVLRNVSILYFFLLYILVALTCCQKVGKKKKNLLKQIE